MKAFTSIIQFQKEFGTEQACQEYLEQQRWNGTPACTCCGSINVTRFKNNTRRFQCNEKGCRKQFSVLTGTFAENTKIPLSTWFLAMYILANHSKGISSLQLSIWLGVTQKTAWFLNHRIREMLNQNGASDLLTGTIEVDESYHGGADKNRHKHKKKGAGAKTMVIGALERGGKVVTKVIPQATQTQAESFIDQTIKEGSIMVTDESAVYNKIGQKYDHKTVNHGEKEYVKKDDKSVHTNGIEGYWNILKKQIVGIHHSVSPKHLQRYCNENAFRYNNRETTQDVRFADALANCNGRLKYSELISNEA